MKIEDQCRYDNYKQQVIAFEQQGNNISNSNLLKLYLLKKTMIRYEEHDAIMKNGGYESWTETRPELAKRKAK